jgi:hypothetical protein
MEYRKQLAIEAATVGAAFVPWSYIVSGLMATTRQQPRLLMVSIFIAGATFHLLAEATGLNEYYLRNSAAQMRAEKAWPERHKNVPKKEKKCGIYFCGQA